MAISLTPLARPAQVRRFSDETSPSHSRASSELRDGAPPGAFPPLAGALQAGGLYPSREPAALNGFMCLRRALDVLSEGVALYDSAGSFIWANQAMRGVLHEGSWGDRLRTQLRAAVDTLRERLRAHGPEQVRNGCSLAASAGEGPYQLRGYLIDTDLPGLGSVFLLVLERTAPESLALERLRVRYALSKQQVRVIKLLAEGKSNEEIGRTLCISPHTARHHTEHILRKLNLHSRAGVAARLLKG